jgi:hypothetical protein
MYCYTVKESFELTAAYEQTNIIVQQTSWGGREFNLQLHLNVIIIDYR